MFWITEQLSPSTVPIHGNVLPRNHQFMSPLVRKINKLMKNSAPFFGNWGRFNLAMVTCYPILSSSRALSYILRPAFTDSEADLNCWFPWFLHFVSSPPSLLILGGPGKPCSRRGEETIREGRPSVRRRFPSGAYFSCRWMVHQEKKLPFISLNPEDTLLEH